jgi:hypothetical protein
MSVPKPSVISLVDNLEIICCAAKQMSSIRGLSNGAFVLLAQAARVG